MRTLTSNAAAKAAAQFGTDPILVIKIEWGGTFGDVYYSETDLTIESTQCQGRLREVGDLESSEKEDGVGSFASISVKLDDTKSTLPTIKSIIDSTILEGKKCTVYHYFADLLLADLIPVMAGKISSPIAWSEGDRSLSFDIVSSIEDKSVGFSTDETVVSTIFKDSINKTWPSCFGNPINVPAVRLTGSPNGKLKKRVTSDDGAGAIIYVENGDQFPQGSLVTIKIGTTIYTGKFSGEQFVITTANVPIYTNILWDSRPASDADFHNANVAWLNPTAVRKISGQWVYMSLDPVTGAATPQVNFCYKQEGYKCWFTKQWKTGTNLHELSNLSTYGGINETATLFREQWSPSVINFRYGFNWEVVFSVTHSYNYVRWWWNEGSSVKLNIPDVYIANRWPSTQVVDVKAYRKVEGQKDKQLISIPTGYYSVNLSNSVAGETPTTITFSTSLYDRLENWDDDIYVTLKSTISQNTATAIKYLVDNYTSLTSDSTSFTAVAALITKYPSNFALFSDDNVLKIIAEMAWQARCAVRIEANVVSIVYLGKRPTSTNITLTEDEIELKSLAMTFSEIEQMYTQLTGKWKPDYSYKEDKKLVYRNNVNTFGLKKFEYDFYIYNIESLVLKSLQFWGYRYSNMFRKVNMDNFFTTLKLELFDAVQMSLTNSGLVGNIIGVVQELSLKENDCTISMQLLLASKAGTLIEDVNFWQNDSADVTPTDPITLVTPTLYTAQLVVAVTGNGDIIGLNPDGSAANFQDPTTTKGDILVSDGTSLVRKGVGTNGKVLTARSTSSDGTNWENPTPLTTKGDLLVHDGTQLQRVAVGTDGQNLVADSTQTNGVKWVTPSGAAVAVASLVATSNIATRSGSQTFDGGTTSPGMTVLLTAQTTAAQNGVYTCAAGAWTFVGQVSFVAVNNTSSQSKRNAWILAAANTYQKLIGVWG